MIEFFYIIVYARNTLEALNIGKELFKDLVRNQFGLSASFETWNENLSDEYLRTELSVLSVDHPEGKKLIDYKMDEMWRDFKRNMTRVREFIEKCSDEEIFEEENDSNRFNFLPIGQGEGPFVYLYNNDGEGIVNRRGLKRVLNKYSHLYQDKENPYNGLDVFIVPAQIHY